MDGDDVTASTDTAKPPRPIESLDQIVIRFAGDSGDGMQVTGDRFTNESAIFGNDLSTLPNFPAEIRAPAGTLAGVSAFQVHISDHEILTPGDAPNVLVAMNPAALRANVTDVPTGGTVVVNSDAFDERALEKAGYATSPLGDGSLSQFRVYEVPMTTLTLEACKPTGAKPREAERSKNFFALGLVSWLYQRPTDTTIRWITERFSHNTVVVEANTLAFRAGYNFGETAELFESAYEISAATHQPGTYTNITGNTALAWGLIAAGQLGNVPLFLGSYPITPASDILHELSKHKNFGVRTLQAEDEIAGIGAALGAAFGGALGITTTSGPGIDLKSETVGLAVSLELPLLIVDIQRGGPSTGLPTKTEQSDLLHAMFGRHGEAPVPIVAAMTPSHCFDAAIEAVRIALKYRTPVYLLSDGYLANGSEPWKLPNVEDLPDISTSFATEPNSADDVSTPADGDGAAPVFLPYLRDPETLARPWAVPGTPGLEHRIGGLEKEDKTGNVSYDAVNHETMVRLRAAKIAGIAKDIPLLACDDPTGDAQVLVLSWGSTYAAALAGVRRVRKVGGRVAQAHLVHLNPFPSNLGDLVRSYARVLIPEGNLGQLSRLVRADFLVDVRSLTKVQGTPFRVAEVEQTIHGLLREIDAEAAASGTDHGSPTNGSPTNGSPTNGSPTNGSPTNGSTANEGATGR
jgi:2-oxoglutarate ferredoxin oxidoreductase subunit alpha